MSVSEIHPEIKKEMDGIRQELLGMRHELDNADRIIGQLQRQNANQQQLLAELSEELRTRDAAVAAQSDEQLRLSDTGTG
jgi:signal transduction histidine kinase